MKEASAHLASQLFTVDFPAGVLYGDVMPPYSQPRLLCLHGAGTAHRGRYEYLRQPLAQDGIASASFDFIGHGETGGDLKQTSLIERTQQALSVIQTLEMEQPLSLIGGSMGAYTAIKLTEHVGVRHLILVVPAAYHRDTYTLRFDDGFTEKLREPESWKKSDVYDVLGHFTGHLLIITAGEDTVIPKEIPLLMHQAATSAASRQLHEIIGAPHRIMEYLTESPSAFGDYYKTIHSFLQLE